ncbi:MAG: 3-phosphoshikimate 1-carboxyvinyltransferase [Peptococcaceae bacterium]|jgi:3-phosphoshikimate 1-carboxyvinyltransferase|nr:3-phosphoshikimate 1-carboxyvinyltransferase [Peptococcaceae bacterium]
MLAGVYIQPAAKVRGTVRVAADKSISHRAALLGGMAKGETRISNFLTGQDCLSTLQCLKTLGVRFEQNGSEIWIQSEGVQDWQEPEDILQVGNSGTTMRLLLGVLAGSPFSATLTGDASIRSRPMRRVTAPLREMGAKILGRRQGTLAPLTISGGQLQGREFTIEVASAQVKSALILAGLRAKGTTSVTEPAQSRDHTERMLQEFGVPLERTDQRVAIQGGAVLHGQNVRVPGDISSAAFFLVLGSLAGAGEIVLPEVGINPTRTGVIDALRQMGADITESNREEIGNEPRATLTVRPAKLRGIEIAGEIIPRLIDELPILAVAGCLAEGETVIRDAAELRVKETDRIKTMTAGLQALGARIEERPDGVHIWGGPRLTGGQAAAWGDHRLAMAWTVAGLVSQTGVSLQGLEAAAVSYPDFYRDIQGLVASDGG